MTKCKITNKKHICAKSHKKNLQKFMINLIQSNFILLYVFLLKG